MTNNEMLTAFCNDGPADRRWAVTGALDLGHFSQCVEPSDADRAVVLTLDDFGDER